MEKRKSKLNRNNWFDYLNIAFMIIFCFITLFPLWAVLVGSFNQGLDYTFGGVYFWPRVWTLDNYYMVIADEAIWRGYIVTIGRTLLGTVTSVLFTSVVAFGMSNKLLKCRKIYYWFMMVTMFFGGGIIPYFVLLKTIGLLNNFMVYIIPSLFSVYNMIVLMTFFSQIPESLAEFARLDGAGEYRILFSIILPLSKPILATVALWSIVGHWNSYMDAMYYVTDPDLYPLQYVLMRIINKSTVPTTGIGGGTLPPGILETVTAKTISFAAIIVSTVPVLVCYPFLQKHFASGATAGAIKE
ncbi:MAG: carbohydrate ABC transporter permease [Clostridia bacterium]|nr:carbohydrate ABC transporter permease [Clostridia bacterium]